MVSGGQNSCVKVVEKPSRQGKTKEQNKPYRQVFFTFNELIPQSNVTKVCPTYVMRGTSISTPGVSTSVDFRIIAIRPEHQDAVRHVIATANGYDPKDPEVHTVNISNLLEVFPQGQFAAVVNENGQEKIVGVGLTMRTSYPPDAKPKSWMDMLGDYYSVVNHEADGEWLYGIDIAVLPEYQGNGVAGALYKSRLGLAETYNLKGWYAGCLPMGYHTYKDILTPQQYVAKVIRGELRDPTISVQMKRGLKPVGIIENYYDEEKTGGIAVLMVWQPEHKCRHKTQLSVRKRIVSSYNQSHPVL
jgi:GNAT superfamily N-acetyltransferase